MPLPTTDETFDESLLLPARLLRPEVDAPKGHATTQWDSCPIGAPASRAFPMATRRMPYAVHATAEVPHLHDLVATPAKLMGCFRISAGFQLQNVTLGPES